ncbi:MAG TPA: DUF4252 domain-containing protein [Blastocatellia bacterium]|jgi:hypothetical protein|nr:DUF4252 domain-containing protein [Blastocatellia bacterium]
MKAINTLMMRAAPLCLVLLLFAATPAQAQDAKIAMTNLDRLAELADKTIDVTVDESIIKLTLSILNRNRSADEAKLIDILSGLKGVYVKRFEFEKEGAYAMSDAESIRTQFNGPGWQRVAKVSSKREGSYDVVLMSEGSVIRGLAVLAAEPRALTVVNVVGSIDLAKLRDIEGKFGIPKFGLDQIPGVTVTENEKPKDKPETKKPDNQ